MQNGNQEAGRGLGVPYGLALDPTDKTRPLNIKSRKKKWVLQSLVCLYTYCYFLLIITNNLCT